MAVYKHDKKQDDPFKVYPANTPIGLYIRLGFLKILLRNNEKLKREYNQGDLQTLINCNGIHITLFVELGLIYKKKKVFYWNHKEAILVDPKMITFIIKENHQRKKGKNKK